MTGKFQHVVSISRRLVIAVTLILALTARFAGQDKAIAAAQHFLVGIKVGTQTTSAITTDPRVVPFSPSFDHFTFGPAVEVALPHRLGLEFNALHKHYAYGGDVVSGTPTQPGYALIGVDITHVSNWDFPVMLKWRTIRYRLTPFLSGGLAQRHTKVIEHATSLTGGPPPFIPEPVSVNSWTRGPVVGGGLEYSIRHIHIAPEVRFTHWTQPALGAPNLFPTGPALAWQANPDQLEVLLGLTFGDH